MREILWQGREVVSAALCSGRGSRFGRNATDVEEAFDASGMMEAGPLRLSTGEEEGAR